MPAAEVRRARPQRAFACALVVAATCIVGCKSDLSQQLLERELRYQEDQIYHLQDELAAACAKLEHASGENASLRRQLGVGDDVAPRSAPARPRGPLSAPVTVPPAVQLPETLAPPSLEGVPPLPTEPTPAPGAAPAPPSAAPPSATGPTPADPGGLSLPAASPAGAVRQLSFTEPADDEPATHLVVNPAQTVCVDADGDGTSEGITIVVEPRDAGDRLVAAPGAVSIAVFDAAAGIDPATAEAAPIARWDIPAADAAPRFRRTSRQRGLHFELPWPGGPPAGGHVKVAVRLAPPDGQPLDADATIAVR